jgi:NAD(P)-dependent dehydrogenase (short-subunit alcohol dehydrogenase family)
LDINAQTALVTGGSAGIGKAIAERLAREGAHVVVADIDRAAADRGTFLEVDVTDQSAVKRMIEQAEPTILVNNAGGYQAPVFPDAPIEHWRRAVELNLGSVMNAIHFAVPPMARRGGGAIVNIGSSAGLGLGPHPGPEYAAAKAAVVRLTASLESLAERGIRVNCVCPHTVATPAVRARIAEIESRGEPLPPDLAVELIEPDDVADAVVELIADEALAGRVMVLRGGTPRRLLPNAALD